MATKLYGAPAQQGGSNEATSGHEYPNCLPDTKPVEVAAGLTSGSYVAALMELAPAVPVVGLTITIVAFYGVVVWIPRTGGYGFPTFAIGAGIPLALWLLAAIPVSQLTVPERANQRHFRRLTSWLLQFEQRINIAETMDPPMKPSARMALAEAREASSAIREELAVSGPQWMGQSAYVRSDMYRHRAEEAWIQCAPAEDVMRAALEAQRRLKDSKIDNNEQLQQQLLQAVNALGPAAQPYAASMQPYAVTPAVTPAATSPTTQDHPAARGAMAARAR